jgi:Right handed beta helix region
MVLRRLRSVHLFVFWVIGAVSMTVGSALLALGAEGANAKIVPGKRLKKQRADFVDASPAARTSADPPGPPAGPSRKHKHKRKHKRRCRGLRVPAGANLQAAVRRAPRGAKLCLARGTYKTAMPIEPKDGQTIVGVSHWVTSVETATAETVLDLDHTSGVTVRRLAVSGAVAEHGCKPGCGRGIAPGRNTVIARVSVYHNEVMGIAGSEGGLVIKRSRIHDNGSEEYFNCCAGGVKAGTAFTIRRSMIRHNIGVGVWCDVGCEGGRFRVLDNIIVRNRLGGIRYEVSGGSALIRGNAVYENNLHGAGGHGGIELNSSRNIEVRVNTIGRNGGPGVIVNGRRPPGIKNVEITHNRLHGDGIKGCGPQVTCSNNS